MHFRREQGLAISRIAENRIGVGLRFRLRGVVLQIGLRKVIAVDFAPVAVGHRQRVAAAVCFRSRDQLVGSVVGEVLREWRVVQPRVDGDYLGHVANSYPFDNMFF